MFALKDKSAVIIGGASELGREIAKRFSRAGAKVAVGDSENAGGFVGEDQIRKFLEQAKTEFGKLDILINLSLLNLQDAPVAELSREALDQELFFRLKAMVLAMKYAAQELAEDGAIINLAPPSPISREAAIAITRTGALELAEKGIRANCICPSRGLSRFEEPAGLFHFLASDDCAFLTGVAFNIDAEISGPGRGEPEKSGNPDAQSDYFPLAGKVAVVTGAASGLGKATALRFARAGAKVVLADKEDAEAAAKEAGGIFIRTDVSQEAQVEDLMKKTVAQFGRLDLVVNNAGIEGKDQEIKDIEEREFEEVLSNNLKSVIFGIKHAIPRISDRGSIMSTASYAGLFGTPMYGNYIMSKAGIIGLTKKAAAELAPRKIRVNCICPGTMDTPMIYKSGQAAEVELALAKKLQPLARLGKPEEAAALFHYLASDQSAFLTGQAIPLDGGMSAGPGYGIVAPLYALKMLKLMPLIDLLIKWFK